MTSRRRRKHPSEANVNGDTLSMQEERAVIHTYTHVSSIANVNILLFVEDRSLSLEKGNEEKEKRK